MATAKGRIMILGGGAAGIQASLDLANMGFDVHLIEESSTLGERSSRTELAIQADPSVSLLYPKMVECARHPRIVLHTYSEVTELKGSRGDFNVKVSEKPRYVSEDRCIGCQACVDKCPAKAPNELDTGKSTRKAIYMPLPEPVPRIVAIDSKNCLFFTKSICRVCEKFCTSKAIDFEQKPRETELNVAAIVVAPLLDQTRAPIFPGSRAAGIYHCQYPAEHRLGNLEEAVKLGAAVAKRLGQDMVGGSGLAELNKMAVIAPKGITAVVDPTKCNACGACENLCASGAPKVMSTGGQKVSQINPMLCEGCGTCVAGCPRFAITLQNYADDQILNQIKVALNGGAGDSAQPRILMFACKYCGFPITERTGAWKTDYPENVRVVSLPCSGRLDPFIVVAALRAGADGVIISGCRPGYCRFLTGNRIAEQRYEVLQVAMESLGAGSGRVRLQWISPSEPKPFTSFVKEMSDKLRALGPNQTNPTTESNR